MERYVIHVTKECNMACTYCYEKDKTSVYEWEEVKELIDNIIKFNTQKEFSIEFLGGEPLLAFDLIQKTVEYIKTFKDINVPHYGITTNGILLPEGLIEFMQKHPEVSWSASMDGTKNMNQLRIIKDGVNSHDIVLENFRTLRKALGGVERLAIHMVTHPYNIHKLKIGIEHLYKEGVRVIGVGTVESTMIIDDEYCNFFVAELLELSKEIKNGRYPGLSIDVLSYLKPKTDVRHYIRDESGKVIAETYGRAGADITTEQVYNAYGTASVIGNLIEDIREIVYLNHRRVMEGNYEQIQGSFN